MTAQPKDMGNTPIIAVLSFVIPLILMLIILMGMGFYPFGEKSLLIMDMADQYVQFFEYLSHIASGEGSIFFSWSKSYGTNFIGLFAYYLSSPLSALMLLFRDSQAGILALTVLKSSLCGMSSFFYFYNVCRCKNWAVLIFTTSYALMSYNIVYSMSLMWLDAVILLPVILIGAERILGGGKPWLFIFTLATLLISNYYTGYMVCIFALIYTLCRYFSKPRDGRTLSIPRALGIFGGSYAAALGLSAWLLIPVYLDLASGKLVTGDYIPPGITSFPFYMYIRSFLPGAYSSISTEGLPMLYTGILTTVLCVYFFISANVTIRTKVCAAALLAALLCSFLFVKLDMVWHIFRHPNWFPYRYAFVFQFASLAIACAGWQKWTEQSLILKLTPSALAIVLLLLVCVDMSVNASLLLRGLDSQFGYKPASEHRAFRNETKPVIDAIHTIDDGFYRIEKTYTHSMNDALGLGYRGITHYSSMFSADLLNITRRLGMAQEYIWNGYIGSTPATDSLFGVKYILSKTPLTYYDVIFQSGDISVYENPHAMPVAFVSGRFWDGLPGSNDSTGLQSRIFERLDTGTGSGLRDITYTARSLHGRFDASADSYLFISIPYDEGWTVKIDGVEVQKEKALLAFMAVPVTAGEHTLNMSYRPQGLVIGVVISALTAAVLVTVRILPGRHACRRRLPEQDRV